MQLFLVWVVSEKSSLFKPKISKTSILHFLDARKAPFFCEGEVDRVVEKFDKTTLWIFLSQCHLPSFDGWKKVEGKVAVSGNGIPTVRLGDVVRFRASFKPISDFKNRGSFRATRYYETKGIVAIAYVSDPSLFVLLSNKGGFFSETLENMRHRIRKSVFALGAEDESSFLLALFLGEQGRMSDGFMDAFRKTGVAHVLSISGLHVTLVSLFFLFLLRFIFSSPLAPVSIPVFQYSPILALFPIWVYVACASFPTPAIRAAILATFLILGMVCWRKPDLLSVLALAAFLILSLSPLSLFDPSFQLSFVAVLFLLLFFPRWMEFRKEWHLPHGVTYLLDLLAVTFIASWGVAPIVLFHFHELSLVGLLANLILLPLLNFLVMPLGLLAWIFVGLFGLDQPMLWWPAVYTSGWVLKIVLFLYAKLSAGVYYGAIDFWQIILFYLASFLWLVPKRFAHFKIKVAVLILLFLCIGFGNFRMHSKNLRIHFVDVGQGDCSVVELPSGEVWVVDGGGIRGSSFDVGRFVVAPFLWEKNIRRVDRLFLSHPHHDHYKGLRFLAQHFRPKILYTNGDRAPEAEVEEWKTFLEGVERSGIEVQTVTREAKPIEVEGGVRIEFFAPGAKGPLKHFDTNDNSVAMRIAFGETRFFFAGDLMEMGEAVLLQSKPNIQSEVLKIGHHGSGTSTNPDFLEAIHPRYAVMSLGSFNPYGMPSKEVLARLQKRGVQLFRTDQQGTITFETDGKTIQVETFVRESK